MENIDNSEEAELAGLEDEIVEDSGSESLAAPEAAAGFIPDGVPVYALRLSYSCETLYGICKEGMLKDGSFVIIPTRYGSDLAQVRGEVKREMSPQKIIMIEQIAADEDVRKRPDLQEKEKKAFTLCQERIAHHDLIMKLIAVHYLYDESKIVFFFSAETRVDFRALVKDLAGFFRSRIELRQIMARDELRISGGFGICGRCYCCASVSDKLKPVSIKMAKEQNLSLNTAKISGPCGRLLCCLAYEHHFYSTERQTLPHEGSRVLFEGESWKVREVNPICAAITLAAEDGRQIRLPLKSFAKVDSKWTVTPVSG
jgi:cell fate regulator YaaT (PSP1 superfamily)